MTLHSVPKLVLVTLEYAYELKMPNKHISESGRLRNYRLIQIAFVRRHEL